MDRDEDPPHQQADHDSPKRNTGEFGARIGQGERSRENSRRGKLVQHQGGCIVHQAFALEHVDYAPGDVEPRQDRRCGHRIGRRNDRTEYEGRSPWHIGNQQFERRADGERCGNHQADGEQSDSAGIGLEVPPGGKRCGLVEDRRQDHGQDDARLQRKHRH